MTPDPDAVYDVLVREAGATDDRWCRRAFTHHHTTTPYHNTTTPLYKEYRFRCLLGPGGKYRSGTNTVDCYPEDMTPERAEIIARTNAALAKLEDS